MTIIKLRRGTASEWVSANTILSDGEVGIERANGVETKFKIGNGVSSWLALPYFSASTGTGGSGIIAGAGAPTSDIGSPGQYYFDQVNNVWYGPKLGATQQYSYGPSDFPAVVANTTIASYATDVTFAAAGKIIGMRYYWVSNCPDRPRTLRLWSSAGLQMALISVPRGGVAYAGWQQALFVTPIAVTAGQVVRAAVDLPEQEFVGRWQALSARTYGDLTRSQESYIKYPAGSYPDGASSRQYYADVVFESAEEDLWPIASESDSGSVSLVAPEPPDPTDLPEGSIWTDSDSNVPPFDAGSVGSLILSGTTAPTPSDGDLGDYYLDTDDDILYGPKVTEVAGTPESVYGSVYTGSGDTPSGSIGNDITINVSGTITGLRWQRQATGQARTLRLWDSSGVQLAVSSPVTDAAPHGEWQVVPITPVAITPGTYRVSMDAASGQVKVGTHATRTTTYQSLGGSYWGGAIGARPVAADARDMFVDLVFQVITTPAWPVALKSVPPGGTTSQVLAKTSATDYAASWAAAPAGLQTRTTTAKTTASLANNGEETGTITLAPGYRILRLQTSVPARVRLYESVTKRTSDSGRMPGTDPTGDHGVILDFVTDVDLDWGLSPTVDGFTSSGDAVPYSITNLSGSTSVVTVTLTWLKTEV